MSLVTDLRARLAVAEETDGPVLLLPVEARDVLDALEEGVELLDYWPGIRASESARSFRAALAVVFADEKETP